MKPPAAFQADYVDLRFVKSRKVCQVVVELPIERAAEFVAAFGAPNPSEGVPVALARMLPPSQKTEEPAPVQKRSWSDMDPAQQCGMRCVEPAFRKFLDETGRLQNDDVVSSIRLALGVNSRSEIKTNKAVLATWQQLEDEYQMWLRVPA